MTTAFACAEEIVSNRRHLPRIAQRYGVEYHAILTQYSYSTLDSMQRVSKPVLAADNKPPRDRRTTVAAEPAVPLTVTIDCLPAPPSVVLKFSG